MAEEALAVGRAEGGEAVGDGGLEFRPRASGGTAQVGFEFWRIGLRSGL